MSLLSRRSKSVSNVVETPAFNTKGVRNSIEHRSKVCSFGDLNLGKESDAKISFATQKSPTIFTKLVASLEKKNNKNGDLNADDEFLTKCYTRPLLPRINTHYPNYGKSVNCDQRNFSLDKKKTFAPDIKAVNTSKHLFNSCAIRSVHDIDQQNSTATTKEPRDAVNEKKVNRKRSIKGMLSSIIGWTRETGKEKPPRFRSCDELEIGEKFSSTTIPIIPRARSLQTFASNNIKDQNIVESLNRNATVRPFYGGRRNSTVPPKFLESRHSKAIPFQEDSGYGSGIFSVEESDDNLVKPSAVREIARRLSYHPEQPWNKKNDTGPCKQVLNYHKREKNSYRRESFTKEIPDVGSFVSLDLANGSTCTVPVSRKLKDEYLSVLAKNKRLNAKYENTHTALYRSQRDRP